jgi:hypothetical protein
MSALFEARATKERGLHLRECALNVICRIPFVNRMALVKVSIELIAIAIYFHSFKIVIIIKKANASK